MAKRLSVLRLSGLCVCMANPLSGLTQEGNTSQAEIEEKRVLEEVFVTATKRSKSVREIPISIDAFSGSELLDKGATSLEEIVKYSPGVIFTKGASPDSGNVTIRGISNAGGLFTRTIGRFYDGVSLINPSIQGVQPDMDPFDMAAVEILKGPQGTLFGGSALAGAIRYVPVSPNLEEGLSGSLSYGYGRTSESDSSNRSYTGMLNIPVLETLGLRYSGSLRKQAGYVDDNFSQEKDINDTRVEQQRLIVQWRINEVLDLQLTYLKRSTEHSGLGIVDGNREDVRLERNDRKLPEFGDAESTIKGFKLDWAVGDIATLSLDSNWLDKQSFNVADATVFLGLEDTAIRLPSKSDTVVDQPSHELRLVSNELSTGWWLFRDWEYVVGLYYMKSDQFLSGPLRFQAAASETLPPELLDLIGIENPAFGTNTDLTALAIEKALYFDVTREFASGFELNLGGRIFDQVTDGVISASTLVEDPRTGEVLIQNQSDSQVLKRIINESGFSPKVALTWHLTDDFALIASYAEGFRFGGVNPINNLTNTISGQPFFFDSDSLTNYEIGVRSTWFERRLTADFAAFFIPWDNMQVQTTFSGTFPAINNVGGAEVFGAEFSVKALLPWGLTIGVNAAHVDSRTTEFFDSSEGPIEPGTRLPLAPRWTASTVLAYAGELGNWSITGSASYSYQGDSKNNFNNTLPLEAFGTVSLAFGAFNPIWPMSPRFSLSVTNLEDDRGLLAGLVSREETANNDIMIPLQPRTVSLTAGISF